MVSATGTPSLAASQGSGPSGQQLVNLIDETDDQHVSGVKLAEHFSDAKLTEHVSDEKLTEHVSDAKRIDHLNVHAQRPGSSLVVASVPLLARSSLFGGLRPVSAHGHFGQEAMGRGQPENPKDLVRLSSFGR